MRRLLVPVLILATGCSDALEQTSSAGQVIGVVNASDRTLSLVSATDFTVSTRDWQTGSATPRTIDGRGSVFVVPLGSADAVGIDFLVRCPPDPAALCVRPDYVLPLAAGSGATGVAIQDDSIAWIANPNRNTVTRLNYLNGDTASVPVGVFPQAVAIVGTRVFVVNGNLAGSTPAGPSWLTSFDCCGVRTADSIPLTGTNARFAVVGDDSLLYVIASGHAGAADGKLSIVDPQARVELVTLNGLGESPGAAAFHPTGSRLLVASATEGILEVNTSIRAITRGPGSGVKPSGHGVSGLAIDLRGRVYAVDAAVSTVPPEFCAVTRGVVHVLTAPPDYREIHTATVGCGPTTAAVAATP
jgi:DNA-binding beta-propeller fold protein YncE